MTNRRIFITGMLTGIILTVVIGSIGEDTPYSQTYLRLSNDDPSLALPTFAKNIEVIAPVFSQEKAANTAYISIYTARPLLDITPTEVESVCIRNAVLDFDGAEKWEAEVNLTDPDAIAKAHVDAGTFHNNERQPIGVVRFGQLNDYEQNVKIGSFFERANPSIEEAQNQRDKISVFFNEMDVPNMSLILLQLDGTGVIKPCDSSMDMTVYDRWRHQWTSGQGYNGVALAPGYKY